MEKKKLGDSMTTTQNSRRNHSNNEDEASKSDETEKRKLIETLTDRNNLVFQYLYKLTFEFTLLRHL